MNITHLKQSQIKEFREKLYNLNNQSCPILKQPLSKERAVLDHIHKQRQTDDITESSGVIRNTIDKDVNLFLGKIENGYKRYIRNNTKNNIELPDLLRNIADYIEKGSYKENNTVFSHPSENGNSDLIKMKKIPFSKRDFKHLNIELSKDNKKPIKYQKFLNSKTKELLDKYLKV